MTNAESAQANSCPTVPVQDDYLSNVTSDYIFLTPKWKTICLKQLQNFLQQRMQKKHKEECIKNKLLADYIYFIANSKLKVCVMSTKAG